MSSGDPRTRARILEKTWQLLERKKGRAARVDDIARAAGVSRQAVYLHFPSRAELLVATVRYVDQKNNLDQRVRSFASAVNGVEALQAFVEFWGSYMPIIHGLAKALLAVRETDKAAAAAWEDRMAALRDGCHTIIECLQRDDLLALDVSTDVAANLLWSMLSMGVWENLTAECGWSNSEYIARMKVVLRQTFVKPS